MVFLLCRVSVARRHNADRIRPDGATESRDASDEGSAEDTEVTPAHPRPSVEVVGAPRGVRQTLYYNI